MTRNIIHWTLKYLFFHLLRVVDTDSIERNYSFFGCNILNGYKLSMDRQQNDRTEIDIKSTDNEKLIIHEGCFRLKDSLTEASKTIQSKPLSTCSAFCHSFEYFVLLMNFFCTCTNTLAILVKTDLKHCGNGCGFPNQTRFVYVYRQTSDSETFLNERSNKCVSTANLNSACETDASDQYETGQMIWLTRERADGNRRLYTNGCIRCKSDYLPVPVPCHQCTSIVCFSGHQQHKIYICQADGLSTPTYINVSEVTDADKDEHLNSISGTPNQSMEYKSSTETGPSTTDYSSEIKPESTLFNKKLTSSLSSQPYDTTTSSTYQNLNQQPTTIRAKELDIDTNDENKIIIISVIAFSSFCIMGSVVACVIIRRKKGNIHILKKEPISKVERTNKETYQLAAEYADPKTFQDPDYADPMNICNSDYDLQMILEDERNNTPREIFTRHKTKQGIQKSLEDTYDHLSFKRINKGSPDFIGGPDYDKLPGIGITHNKAKRQQELYKNQTDTLLKCNTNANRCEQKKGIAAYFETEINHSKFLYDTPKKFVAETSL